MSPEQVEEWRVKCRELVGPKVEGEEVVAAGGFRQGGASAREARRRPAEMAIHRPRGGHYWHYWLVIVGGTAFVFAFYATDGFGLQ